MAAGVVLAVALLWARRAAPGPQVSLPPARPVPARSAPER